MERKRNQFYDNCIITHRQIYITDKKREKTESKPESQIHTPEDQTCQVPAVQKFQDLQEV